LPEGADKTPETLLPANCVEEEYLYVAMQRCKCGGVYEHDLQSLTKHGETACDELTVHCVQCKKPRAFAFDISAFFGKLENYGKITRPSRLFDVVEWLGIAALFIRDSEKHQHEEKRMMLAEADFCLDQVLMFYEGEDDTPVAGAFFNQPGGKIAEGKGAIFSRKQVLKLKERTEAARAVKEKEEHDGGDN
jgi:hypothetical protein